MSESKQEARLRERMEREIQTGIDLVAELTVWAHAHGWRGDDEDPRLGWLDRLRSAIVAALDEARNEALEEAAKKLTEIADERGHHGSGTVRLFVEWCALKSKRGA